VLNWQDGLCTNVFMGNMDDFNCDLLRLIIVGGYGVCNNGWASDYYEDVKNVDE